MKLNYIKLKLNYSVPQKISIKNYIINLALPRQCPGRMSILPPSGCHPARSPERWSTR